MSVTPEVSTAPPPLDECQAAQRGLVGVRNDVAITCNSIRATKSDRNAYATVAAAAFTAGLAFVAAGIASLAAPYPVNLILAAVFFTSAGIAFTTSAVFGGLAIAAQIQVGQLEGRVASDLADFPKEVDTVLSVCDPKDIHVDLSPPQCPSGT